MKKKILKYITGNQGCDLIMIFDEFKKEHKAPVITGAINELEKEGTIELITDNGFHFKKNN